MSDIITPRKITRLEEIESLPRELRDDALLGWKTVTVVCDTKDVENTRKLFKARAAEIGEKLVRIGRRELPTMRTVRKVLASFAR